MLIVMGLFHAVVPSARDHGTVPVRLVTYGTMTRSPRPMIQSHYFPCFFFLLKNARMNTKFDTTD